VKHARFYCGGLVGAMLTLAAPVYCQQPPAPSEPVAPTSTAAPATDTGPSAATLRRARAVGLRPEVRKGTTVYCWKDADLNTRFETKKCVDDSNLEQMIEVLERQKRQIQQDQGRH
jgi:hypothetical protein